MPSCEVQAEVQAEMHTSLAGRPDGSRLRECTARTADKRTGSRLALATRVVPSLSAQRSDFAVNLV